MKAYFLGESNRIASHDDLKGFGVFYKYIDADNYEEPIDAICKERNYKSRDFVKLNQETPDLDKKLDIFFEEHDHTDEEIRYILDGEGYFDVRDNEDRWIRLHVQRGDLIILPPFIYHRFTLTETKYVHAMRLFAENPRWEAYPRGPRSTIVDLCKNFYNLGWVSGTGGGISLRVKDLVFMAPSGVQKERIEEEDIYVMNMKQEPLKFPAKSGKKISACCPLFYAAFTKRNAGACIHSHSINTVLATLNNESEFVVTNLEMIKGIEGHGFYDRLVIPIIENTAHECELTQSLEEAMDKYPDVPAVLVRRHGLYVWGKDWVQAKTHAECLDYLFEIAVKMRQMGVDPAKGLTGPQTN